ncbi:MAG: hypothetical protein VX768_02745 [Planctomycetota bacterium]|nr:hypothetical protein [Planctomycetota bacterium]
MKSNTLIPVLSLLVLLTGDAVWSDDRPRVIWYGTLEGGLAEAKRSDRPILLISAAPHCHSVSGIW